MRTPRRSRPRAEALEDRLALSAAGPPALEDNFGQQVRAFVQALNEFPDQGKSVLGLLGFENRGDAISQAERP